MPDWFSRPIQLAVGLLDAQGPLYFPWVWSGRAPESLRHLSARFSWVYRAKEPVVCLVAGHMYYLGGVLFMWNLLCKSNSMTSTSHRIGATMNSLPRGPMAETFEEYRDRVLSCLGDADPIAVQQTTPSQLERRLRDVAPEELIRRPAPGKVRGPSPEIVAHLRGRGAGDGLAVAKHAGESGRALKRGGIRPAWA